MSDNERIFLVLNLSTNFLKFKNVNQVLNTFIKSKRVYEDLQEVFTQFYLKKRQLKSLKG
jgi:predicted Zn-ribbon and HTH transcriptional regulator